MWWRGWPTSCKATSLSRVPRDLTSSRAPVSATRPETRRPDPAATTTAEPPRATQGGRLWALVPLAVSAAICGLYFLLDPKPFDLAAHEFRTGLFEREGFTIWNGQWYGGHHTPAYSILFPPVAALLGPTGVGLLSAIASTVLFDALVRGHWGERARWGSVWFALGTGTILFTGRLPFGLGVAIGLAALLAFQRRRNGLAALLAVACSLASPVSGAFLALAAVAYGLSGERARGLGRGWRAFRLRGLPTSPGDVVMSLREGGQRLRGGGAGRLAEWARDLGLRPRGFAVAGAALLPPVLLVLAFPEGGYQPFVFSAFFAAPLCALAFLTLLPGRERALKVGAALYLVAVTAAFVIDTPMGSNAVRMGALFGGPLLACAFVRRQPSGGALRTAGLVLVFAGLGFWQWNAAVKEYTKAADHPGVEAAYYEPLLEWLRAHDGGPPGRVHVPFSYSHWEAAAVAEEFPLARGWERQVDTGRNRIFYEGLLSPLTYGAWLAENGVRYVALPSVRPDFSSHRERGLIERGLPYLELRWRSRDWRVYEFMLPHPLALPEDGADMSVTHLGPDEVVLNVRTPGEALLRVRWSPYWKAHGGCVKRDGDWTRVTAADTGRLRLTATFSPERIVDRGPRCAT
jgi:hypothetical protein